MCREWFLKPRTIELRILEKLQPFYCLITKEVTMTAAEKAYKRKVAAETANMTEEEKTEIYGS